MVKKNISELQESILNAEGSYFLLKIHKEPPTYHDIIM